jgi:GTPase
VSSVSPKQNTTDEVLHVLRSLEVEGEEGPRNVQLKYFDTPGLMHNKTGFLSRGWRVLGDIDFSLLVIDSSKRFDDLLKEAISRLEKHRRYEQFMKALVLNKIDLVDNKRKFHGLIAEIEKHGKFDKIFYTSALTGYGVADIETYLAGMARKGAWEHPGEAKTDSSEMEVVEELFKEALFLRTYNQVPYETVLECEGLSRKTNGVHFAQFRLMV